MKKPMVIAAAAVLVAAACSGDVLDSQESQDLEAELAAVRTTLTAVTAERDELAAAAAKTAARHARSEGTQQAITEIIADPASYGMEDEVLDLLDTLAAPGTRFRDDAFGGATGWRSGWRQTLFNDRDGDIHTWQRWLADDGSVGGSLWSWSGTARSGEPFGLIGINLDTFDDDGLVTSETVYYPYESSEVLRIFHNGG
jgi:hypothetical protein